MLPRFEVVRRLRPVDLVAPRSAATGDDAGMRPLPAPAPYVAVTSELTSTPAEVAIHLGGRRLAAAYDGSRVSLVVDGRPVRSRRHGRVEGAVGLALTLTGPHLTAWTRVDHAWTARARRDLREDVADLDVHDPAVLAGLEVETPAGPWTAGPFGQLGLRDLRLVSHADGRPLRDDGAVWLTATSAGPGFADTGHTSVWRLDPDTLDLAHTGDLFFRRPDRPGVWGDHATHVVRDGDRWLVATSTWGDFEQPTSRAERRAPSTLRVTLAEVTDTPGLLHGTHVLDTRELALPTDGLDSVATWDPHLVHRDGRWLVGFVSARRIFSFHPALAAGESLDELVLVGAVTDRTATEGSTLLDVDGELVLAASDGRAGPRGLRGRFPVFGTGPRGLEPGGLEPGGLAERGALDAPYPTNLPWPTLLRDGEDWVMVTFNGRPRGGPLLGYGTHGDVVVMRTS